MIATLPTTIPLLGDVTAELYPATATMPPCLRIADGDDHCSVDLNAVTWAALKARVDEALGVEGTNGA